MPEASRGHHTAARFHPGLDLLRTLAACYIVMFHLNMPDLAPPLVRFFSHGPTATSMFFILSGFLLTLLHAGQPMQGAAQSTFVWRRLARIWPVHLLGLASIALYQMHFGFTPPSNTVLLCAFMIQTWLVGQAHLLNTPAWSISCLLFFYLCFPVLLPRLSRLGTRTLVVCALLLWLLGAGLPLVLAGHPGPFSADAWSMYLHDNPLFRLPAFVLGMLAALHLRRVGPPPRWLFPVAVTGVLLTLLLAPAENLRVNNELFAPLALLLVVVCTNPPAFVARLGHAPLTRRLASATIAVYLLHSFWIQVFRHELGVHHLGWTPVTFVLFLAVVWGSALLVDAGLLPLTRWLRRPRLPSLGVPFPRTPIMPSGDD